MSDRLSVAGPARTGGWRTPPGRRALVDHVVGEVVQSILRGDYPVGSEFPAAADIRRLLRIRGEIGTDAIASVAVVCRTPTTQTLREPAGPAVETIGLDDLPSLLP